MRTFVLLLLCHACSCISRRVQDMFYSHADSLSDAEDFHKESELLARLLLGLHPAFLQGFSAMELSSALSKPSLVSRSLPVKASMSAPSRREAIVGTLGAAAALSSSGSVFADSPKTVVVAGATGQTGRRVLERLATKGGLKVIAGVRDVGKAKEALDQASVTVRGAMVQSVPSIDTSAVALSQLDIEKQDVSSMAATLKGADALVIAVGFVPGNPFKMGDAAHAVDNVGTIKLIDAAKESGISKVVLISSILTDAGAWGQRGSPGFKVTNAFGGVLDEKIVAEKYLRASGLDYTIVRPGGLTAKPPSGNLVISGENTLNSGEVSRDTVADVCVAAVFDSASKNKVVEIFESEEAGVKVPPQDKWFYGLKM